MLDAKSVLMPLDSRMNLADRGLFRSEGRAFIFIGATGENFNNFFRRFLGRLWAYDKN
ncbi:hypothetical protein [Geobacter grbiciae]|uniref:hypothetical protein n=1 Tax=Geobacter grbiciae TaxID=155042 RepID=UPI001C00FE58|nr:hypothetical protein [Geobacter grbiciae]MBT1074285.1 hypothetical protein [Geobacter grbiciae]